MYEEKGVHALNPKKESKTGFIIKNRKRNGLSG